MQKKLPLLLLLLSAGLFAQEQMPLKDLSNFEDQAGNWQLVGNVQVNRTIDVHHKPKQEETAKKKKKRKRKKKNQLEEVPTPLFKITPGTGILLNQNDEGKNDALVTAWEHGDLKLELEVLLPKGSNSGIYFQGRYEFQLRDSWEVKSPLISDMGGIHNNWEKAPDKIFRGIPPSSNAAKAPGLWQKIKIHFQAPRFNEAGEKIANAKFVSAYLNDVLILNNVEVPTYTGGPIIKNEVAMGPLLIQGNHGPVALKNIKYTLLKDLQVNVSDLSYKVYQGAFKSIEDMDGQKMESSGVSEKIDVNVVDAEDNYGLVYTGTLDVREEAVYNFSVGFTGGARIKIDGELLSESNTSDLRETQIDGEIELSKGKHNIEIVNLKSAAWLAPGLGLTIEGPSQNPKTFHMFDSYAPRSRTSRPVLVDATSTPRLLRGFVGFNGDPDKMMAHTIGVGTPEAVHFVYDLGSANIIGAWRGGFIDVARMWQGRGNGSFKPRGAVQWTFLNQPIAQLENNASPFPETGELEHFVPKGYTLDKATGLPIFKHKYKGVTVENSFSVSESQTHLIHEVNFSQIGLTNWYMKLAEGEIEKGLDGSYVIGGQQYYVNILSGQVPFIREVNGKSELVIPVDGSSIKYELIW